MKLMKMYQQMLVAMLLGSAAGSAVAPGAATQQAADKLTVLGDKYEKQLEKLEIKFDEQSKEFETKICEGLGCEPDDRKRAQNQIQWDGIVRNYKSGKGHLIKMLAMCWKMKENYPLHKYFAEWIAQAKLEAKSATVWNVERELRCDHYAMGFEDVGGGHCGEGKAGGGGLIVPAPSAQPSGCIPMPTKMGDESDEEAAKEASLCQHLLRSHRDASQCPPRWVTRATRKLPRRPHCASTFCAAIGMHPNAHQDG